MQRKKSISSDLAENYKIYATEARESNGVLRFPIDQCSAKLYAINFIFLCSGAIKFILLNLN